MKRILSLLLSVMLLLSLAAGTAGAERDPGVYRTLYDSEMTTLNYLVTGNTNDLERLSQCVENLAEYDTYGNILPGLAESWSANEDNTVWTFKIREGIQWVDSSGSARGDLTAQDWVTTAHYVNEAKNNSAIQYMYEGIVLGAQEYYEQSANMLAAENAVTDGEAASVEEYYAANEIDPAAFISVDDIGVKAVDTYTLEYTMVSPCPYFPSVLSYASYLPVYAPFLEEVTPEFFGIDNESILYCGAYIMTQYEPQRGQTFEVNPLYWDLDNVFVQRLEWIYNAQASNLAPTMFLNEEVDYADINSDIIEEWFANENTKDLLRPTINDVSYSYFYAFNFEPRFDEAYEPANWLLAVNNESFRKALMHGLDRMRAASVYDPYTPENMVNNTITPRTFVDSNGKDYTEFGGLSAYTDGDTFDEAKAAEYRDAAVEELTAAGATFPIKVLMPYNPTTSNWDKECLIVEQQLENLLGSDFIDIIVEAGPESGFLGEVRRSGKYAFMKCNWGADYADPQTWTDPFDYSRSGVGGNSYNFMYTDAQKAVSAEPAVNKSEETQAMVSGYYELLDAAKAITDDNDARFEAFAQAETYLLDHAVVVPFSTSFTGYIADMRNPFDRQSAPYGLSPLRMKGRKLLDAPMSADAFQAALENWLNEKAAN